MKINRKNSKKRSRDLKKTARRLAAYSAAAAATVVTSQDRAANAEDRVWDIPDITVGTTNLNFFMDTGGHSTSTGYVAGMTTLGRMRLVGHIDGFGDDAYIYAPTTNSGFVATTDNNAARLGSGVPVAATNSFGIGVYAAYPNNAYASLQAAPGDPWRPGTTGFVGIKFDLAGGTHFGWAEISRWSPLVPQLVTLHGFGYNDAAGVASVTPTVSTVDALSLEVNMLTGEISLLGHETSDVDINNYQITSAGNSLDDENWYSLEDQDFDGNGPPDPMNPGNGWEESGGVGPDALAEGYLLGDSTIDANASVSLGMGYDVGVDAQDLEFRFRTASGHIFGGLVQYVARLEADFDEDGDVDGDDFLAWQGGFGTPSGAQKSDGDYDNDGDVDGDDFLGWQDEFGSPGEGGSQGTVQGVPEPSSMMLLAAGAAGLGMWRRRRTGKAASPWGRSR